MALDTNLVCPACRRFWHGPAGQIQHWYGVPGYERGGPCVDPRHAAPAPKVKAKLLVWGEVTLTPERDAFAISVGEMRQARRERAGHRNAYASMDEGEDHVLGARGECAYSQLSGRPWTGATTDIGGDNDVDGVQVRTRREHNYDLYLWPHDKADAWWVLMTGHGPTFVCQGRIWGGIAKGEEFFTEARPQGFPRAACFVVPQRRLEKELA